MRDRGSGTRRGWPSEPGEPGWDGQRVRALRRYLGESQGELAERLGTRQQTVSEWETGASRPRRMSRRLLHLVAEDAGFYSTAPLPEAGEDADDPDGEPQR